MTGKRWATAEQDAFLDAYNAQYVSAQKTTNFKKFWGLIEEAWFNKYPEIGTQFPDKSQDNLTEIEEEALKQAIQKRQAVSSDPIVVSSLQYITEPYYISNLKVGIGGDIPTESETYSH
jgi:hypothetical protein